MVDVKPFISDEPWHTGAMLPNNRCLDCGYVCQWPEVTIKGAAVKNLFIDINRTKMKLLYKNMDNQVPIVTASGDCINSYFQKLDGTRLYTNIKFDYAYARQLNHRQYTSVMKYRFGTDFGTLKQDVQDERNYNFILIQPTKWAIEKETNEESWSMCCPKCCSEKSLVLYDDDGEYHWYV